MKLLTTAGALFVLKPEFRFRTLILTDGEIIGDTLKGDILIKGEGDPSLNDEKLSKIARQLKIKGISCIKGDILFDDSYFDTIPFGKGWMWDDLNYEFSAPISALSVNGNTCKIYVQPGEKPGDQLIINIVPKTEFISIRNLASTGDKTILSATRVFEDDKNIIVVKGSLPVDDETKVIIRTIEKPSLFTTSLFQDKLKENGIKITGKTKRGSSSQFQDTLFSHLSEPLIKILYDMDKKSSNFIAEHILKTLGAEVFSPPGTAEKGIKAIETSFKQRGIMESILMQKDGSGLSRYNLVSPQQITELLMYLYHNFENAPEFLMALPSAGVDGTLKNRMKDQGLQRKVRAKTGTMSGVSTLSGYCVTNSGRVLIFSIMMKDYIAPVSHVREIQDKILKTLIEY